MLWLAVHLPMFALEASQAGRNTGVPTVLVDGNRILLGNQAALHAGIGLQSTLATASGICPRLIHCRRDPGKERKRLQLLAEMCYRFTSRVSLELPQGTQAASSLLLEVGGSLKLCGAMHVWQSRVAGLCRELGHAAVLRTAATPSAALALARAGASRLADVPLIHTELAESEVESLSNMGIKTLGPLLRLPEVELGQRFGTRLTNYLRRLAGAVPDPRHCIEPRPVFASTLNLLDPITDKGALLFPMQRLLTELQCWLIGRQLGAERLLWHFAPHESAARVRMPVRFAAARQRKVDFIEIVRLALNRAELPENVLEIGLKAEPLVPWMAHNQTLFELPPDQPGEQSLQPGSARGHPSHEKAQPGSARGHPPHEKAQPGSARGHPPHEKTQPGSARGYPPHEKAQPGSARGYPPHEKTQPGDARGYPPHEQSQPGNAKGHPPHEQSRPGGARDCSPREKTWPGGTRKHPPHEAARPGSMQGHPSQAKELPTELIDRFAAHLGEAGCSGIAATGQHVPEQAWRRCHTGGASGSPDSRGRADRPLWLFDSPQRVNREEFEILSGPERLQTGWWRYGKKSFDSGGAYSRSRAESFHTGGVPSRSPAESFHSGGVPLHAPVGSFHAGGAPSRSPAESFHARGAPSRSPAESFHARGTPSRSPAEGSSHRDYYVVRHGSGARGWVFVDGDGQWFLHGYFG